MIAFAPASTAARATSARVVSTEIGASIPARRTASITGTTRRICSASSTRAAPGRVDSPPMSSIAAPSASARSQYASARSGTWCSPPSENESGVTFTTAMSRGRSSDSSHPRITHRRPASSRITSMTTNVRRPGYSELMQDTLIHLASGHTLTEQQAGDTFRALLRGELDDAQIGALLALLAARQPTVDELVGAARVMREFVTPVPISDDIRPSLVDTCGTGGAPKTFNISTAAALIAAGAGEALGDSPERIRVAKHGNRSRTGRGSAEVLKQLGVNIDATPQIQAKCLVECAVCFCFAIHHHPAMKHAAAARKSIGFPTIFNLLGPLTNPAGASQQLLGVYDGPKAHLLGEALARLGARRAMVVHGEDGLDEITTTTTTLITLVDPTGVRTEVLDAQELGVARCDVSDLACATLEDAAVLIGQILGGEPGPAREIACLNAGAALVVAGAADSLDEGLARARESVDSGAAARTLERLARVSREGF